MSNILYDVTLKFESELFVSVLGEAFEKDLLSMFGQKSGIGSVYTVSHDMSITDTPVIPDNEAIENLRKIIFQEVSKAFSDKSDVEVKNTKFIGITNIKRKN